MKFCFKTIDEMTGYEAFCVERLRNEVFVSEQKITLPEIDDEDLDITPVKDMKVENEGLDSVFDEIEEDKEEVDVKEENDFSVFDLDIDLEDLFSI